MRTGPMPEGMSLDSTDQAVPSPPSPLRDAPRIPRLGSRPAFTPPTDLLALERSKKAEPQGRPQDPAGGKRRGPGPEGQHLL